MTPNFMSYMGNASFIPQMTEARRYTSMLHTLPRSVFTTLRNPNLQPFRKQPPPPTTIHHHPAHRSTPATTTIFQSLSLSLSHQPPPSSESASHPQLSSQRRFPSRRRCSRGVIALFVWSPRSSSSSSQPSQPPSVAPFLFAFAGLCLNTIVVVLRRLVQSSDFG
ncbi:hypothetical protein PIB30_096170 [Stylosanthes scabra]|uniref:Uncharacterized protein n=1 Tax=Stylosanthes scabra TaxID=79078 RepID=A0ABU6UUV5_9FABA|nr:hypothetical protein [Stylosanthes scabra]